MYSALILVLFFLFFLQIFQRLSHTGPILHKKIDGVTTLTYLPTPLMRSCEKSPGEMSFKL